MKAVEEMTQLLCFAMKKKQLFFGKIVKIFQVDHNFKLFIETLSCEPVSDSIVLPCIYKVTGSSSIVVINSHDILEKCIVMHMEKADL